MGEFGRSGTVVPLALFSLASFFSRASVPSQNVAFTSTAHWPAASGEITAFLSTETLASSPFDDCVPDVRADGWHGRGRSCGMQAGHSPRTIPKREWKEVTVRGRCFLLVVRVGWRFLFHPSLLLFFSAFVVPPFLSVYAIGQESAVLARAMFCQTCSLRSPSAATEALEATRTFRGPPPHPPCVPLLFPSASAGAA